MANIYHHIPFPSPPPSSSSNASSCLTSSREIYTLWMKSLVLNGNGCTIYDSNGKVVYRVDNYDQKCCNEVYLMDQGGKTLYKMLRKSLVLNGNGCTIYDSNGKVVYRVDNYDQKCCNEVYLMDQGGKTLYKMLRKKLRVFGRWEAYSNGEEKRPRFRVKKAHGILK
ncbi:putative protein LURP-one-related 11-like [Cocos nucifera]|uniref:Uncharacterized protein n=1 Tax=Cocos nucifera TaxID=13894 RepID=A0A8K0ISM6_COCNU|nr:putative protein LURP-one-related 11-like [Cocos nucifera]